MLIRGEMSLTNHQRLEIGQVGNKLDAVVLASMFRMPYGGILGNSSGVFDGDGKFLKPEFDAWTPDFSRHGILVQPEIPKTLALIVWSALDRFPRLGKAVNLTNLRFFPEEKFLVRGYTSQSGRNFRSGLDFSGVTAENALKPWVPGLRGVSPGVCLGSYSVLAEAGNFLYARINYDANFELLASFFAASGWSKTPQAGYEKAEYQDRRSIWYRRDDMQFPSLSSSFSPLDDFSESFVYYLTHNKYLAENFPDRYDAMKTCLDYYEVI